MCTHTHAPAHTYTSTQAHINNVCAYIHMHTTCSESQPGGSLPAGCVE
jgi:hypothetical protein